jgi:hypothetical protein
MIPAPTRRRQEEEAREAARTWQGRLPQELRIRAITTPEDANRFLKRSYTKEFNRKFVVQAAEPNESAFVPCQSTDLDRVFSIQSERTVNRDNTVKYKNLTLQIDKQSWRRSLDGCRVMVYQHLDDTITIGFGPQQIGKYTADGKQMKPKEREHRPLERKGLAPLVQNGQTGHLMC